MEERCWITVRRGSELGVCRVSWTDIDPFPLSVRKSGPGYVISELVPAMCFGDCSTGLRVCSKAEGLLVIERGSGRTEGQARSLRRAAGSVSTRGGTDYLHVAGGITVCVPVQSGFTL